MARIRLYAVVLSFATAFVAFFLRDDPEVYIPYSTFIPLLFFLPSFWYRHSSIVRRRVTREWAMQVERAGLAVLLLNIPAVLLFHELLPQIQFDRLLHFGVSAVGVIGVVLVCMPLASRGRKRDLLWAAGLFSFVFIFAWEGYQYLQDMVFGTHSFFDYAQPLVRDFWEDIVFGALGVLVGLIHASRNFRRLASVHIAR